MTKFKNHRGELCLYVTIKDGYILIMDDTFDEHYEFYYIGVNDYVHNKSDWQSHLSCKNWGTPELIKEIDRQVFGEDSGIVRAA